LDGLQVRQIVNRIVPSEADIDLGRIVLLLVLNRLLSPEPLYQVAEWLGQTILPEWLEIELEQVYDNRLGVHWIGCTHILENCGEHSGTSNPGKPGGIRCFALDLTSIYFEGSMKKADWRSMGIVGISA